eukprot:1858241-Pyramimonas_sp.AAC.1
MGGSWGNSELSFLGSFAKRGCSTERLAECCARARAQRHFARHSRGLDVLALRSSHNRKKNFVSSTHGDAA